MTRDPSKDHTGGIVLIFVTLLGWSSVPLFLKYFTTYIDGWTANGWRYGISALFWSPLLIHGAARGRLPKGLWRAALVPSLFNFAAQMCFAWAPYYINPGLITFLLRLQIVFVALGAYLLFPGERALVRSAGYVSGVVLVMFGLLGLCFLGNEPPRGATAVGIALGMAAGLLYGGYSLSVRYYMNEIRSATAFAAISSYTAAGVIPVMLLFARGHGAEAAQMTWGQLAMLTASAFAGIAITHVTYYAAIARLGVALAGGVILLQPFLTTTASSFLFDERLTSTQWLGGATAVAGAVVMLDAQRRRSRRAHSRSIDPAPALAASADGYRP